MLAHSYARNRQAGWLIDQVKAICQIRIYEIQGIYENLSRQ